MEIGATGLGYGFRSELPDRETILEALHRPNSRRIFALRQALVAGISEEEIFAVSSIDPWFIRQVRDIVDMEKRICNFGLANDMVLKQQRFLKFVRYISKPAMRMLFCLHKFILLNKRICLSALSRRLA